MSPQDFISFHNASRQSGVIMSFSGDVSEKVLFSLGEVLRFRMTQGATDASIAKRVFSVFVEQAQNIIRYSADRVAGGSPDGSGVSAGMIVVGMEEGRFFVACGNEVPQAQVEPLRARLSRIAGMNQDELKAYYREKIRQPAEEGSLGGSIGLIEIARRASAPVEFDFRDLGAHRSFFCLKAYI
ncbi:SiaB family protein kinase [Enterovirga aerilata]|uniref:Histidine kinase n=1 Tax=Enterovirga aerilata TaxID=2730920 RepID=A0A849I3R5_9HYPH|nr:hypothetical protein [Enterovirga sp. DB1703]